MTYDLRDVVGDRNAGVRTFAVVHGFGSTVNLVRGLLLAAMIPLPIGYLASVVPWKLAVLTVGPAIQWILFTRAAKQRSISQKDCIVMTWVGAGLLMAYVAWVAAGLPLILF